jgi:hypothetical protein
MKNFEILIRTGAVAGLLLMAYSFYLAHTLTPELLPNLYLGGAFFVLLIFRAILAEGREFDTKQNMVWSKISLFFGYVLILFLLFFLIFRVNYPEHGFVTAFTAPVSILCFIISYRFYKKDKILIRASPFINKAVLIILAITALVYLYDIPKAEFYPPAKYSILFDILFVVWACLILAIVFRQ